MMLRWTYTLVALAALVASSSCGGRSELHHGVSTEDPPTPPGPPNPPGPPPERPPWEATYNCAASDSSRPMLAALADHTIFYAYPNGETRSVFTYDLPPSGSITRTPSLAAYGHLVTSHAIITPANKGDFEPYLQVLVMALDGQVTFNERYPFGYTGTGTSARIVGDGGSIVVHSLLETSDRGFTRVVNNNVAAVMDDRWIPRSELNAAGDFLVRGFDSPSTAELYFGNAHTLSAQPSLYLTDPDRASSPAIVGADIVYLRRQPSRLTVETAKGRREIPITITHDPVAHASPSALRDGSWVAFGLNGESDNNPQAKRYLVADLNTDAWQQLTLTPPPGWNLPKDTWNVPGIDSSGRFLVLMDSGTSVQLFRSSDGVSWQEVGQTISTQTNIVYQPIHAGGAVVWGRQLVGPQGGEGVKFNLDQASKREGLSADGKCHARSFEGALLVVETSNYTERAFPWPEPVNQVAWIPNR